MANSAPSTPSVPKKVSVASTSSPILSKVSAEVQRFEKPDDTEPCCSCHGTHEEGSAIGCVQKWSTIKSEWCTLGSLASCSSTCWESEKRAIFTEHPVYL